MQAVRTLLQPTLILVMQISLPTFLWADTGKPVAPKGDRLLGLGINEGSIGFERAFAAAREAGMQFTELATQWDDIEPKLGEFTNQWLDIANAYYPRVGIRLVISLNPIDTNRLRLPADLRDKPLDDPAVIQRYNKAADYVLSRVSDSELVAFAVGNEIDGYLGVDREKWQQYERFFQATSRHIRARRPGVVVGTKVMLPSLIGENHALAKAMNVHADAVLTTYYPLGDGFRVKTRAEVDKDLNAVFQQYKHKSVYLLEVGCPSSTFLGSSDGRQAEFVRQVFKFWDDHRERLKVVNFIWLHDISATEVQSYTKYYKLNDRGFAEYLGSLGLRHHDGKDKDAFTALQQESKSRGW